MALLVRGPNGATASLPDELALRLVGDGSTGHVLVDPAPTPEAATPKPSPRPRRKRTHKPNE